VKYIFIFFPDPTLESSYMCMWNGTIFIHLCSSHGGIFREKILRVCYLVSALKSYVGANNYIDLFTFLLNSKNVAYPISFVISVLSLTEFASQTQTLNNCVKCFYRNKSVTLWTCRLTEYWLVFELWPYRQFVSFWMCTYIPLTCTWILSSKTHAILSVFICMLLRWKIIEFEHSLNSKIFWEISKKILEKGG